VPLVLALGVLAWARATRKPRRELGLAPPSSWTRALLGGALLGALLKLVLKAVVLPLLGADPVNHAYHFLAGNPAALPGMIATIVLSAGFGEEILYRGYLFERSRTWFGSGRAATIATVAITALLFGLAHVFDQGWEGVRQGVITGLVFGALYARTRTLWAPIAAHVAFDLVAVAIIELGLETRIAHLFMR
jgi:membrane protease YdiL (CAAX protease family)